MPGFCVRILCSYTDVCLQKDTIKSTSPFPEYRACVSALVAPWYKPGFAVQVSTTYMTHNDGSNASLPTYQVRDTTCRMITFLIQMIRKTGPPNLPNTQQHKGKNYRHEHAISYNPDSVTMLRIHTTCHPYPHLYLCGEICTESAIKTATSRTIDYTVYDIFRMDINIDIRPGFHAQSL